MVLSVRTECNEYCALLDLVHHALNLSFSVIHTLNFLFGIYTPLFKFSQSVRMIDIFLKIGNYDPCFKLLRTVNFILLL